jgi:molecular chaperone GrpE (heat shock protein)
LITTRRKTEKNKKKAKKVLFWTYRPKGPNERENNMNSTELAQAIEAEQDKINELEAEILELERSLRHLREEQTRKERTEADKFISDHIKIIMVN